MWNAVLDEKQAGIKIIGRNINNFRYAYDTTLMAESEEELKSLLMRVKEKSKKAGLKLNIQKMKIMASSPITAWQIDGETMGNSDRVYFLGLQTKSLWMVTAAMKLRRLLLGKKAMTNLHSILKNKDVTLPTKVYTGKGMVFPVMYGCESWTIKKAECRRTDSFQLWYWGTLLRVPGTARRSN